MKKVLWPLLALIVASCDKKAEVQPEPVVTTKVIEVTDTSWNVVSKNCDGVEIAMQNPERISFSDGAFLYTYITKVTLLEMCIDTDISYRSIEKLQSNPGIYTESSNLISAQKRKTCFDSTGNKTSEQTSDLPFQALKVLVSLNPESGTISLSGTSQCKGLLNFNVTLKK